MMQYGIKLSTKQPSETNNNFKKFLFKINHFFKFIFFTIFQVRLRYIVSKNNIDLKYFADIRFGMF